MASSALTPAVEPPGSEADSGDLGEVAAAEQAGARSFLRGFLALFVTAVAALTASSVLLDPAGVFDVRIVPASQQTTRDDKARAFAALAEKPETLVLGSSRVWSIRPARLQELVGGAAFNFGVDNGVLFDFDAVYGFARQHGGESIRRVVLGLDVEVFDETRGGRLEYSRLIRPYAEPGAMPSFARMLPEYLLGTEIVDSDLRSLKNLLTGKVTVGNRTAVLPKNVFKADGAVTWPRFDEARRSGTFDLDEQVSRGVGAFKRVYAEFHRFSPARVAGFRRFLARMRAEGVTVDVYIPPLHPRAMRELPGLAARVVEGERLLAALDAEGLVHFHRRARLADFGGDPAGFYDFQHMTAENGDRLLARICAPTPER
jgi:hypothetical protein